MGHDYKDQTPWEIGTAAWERGYLRPWELFRIAAWKSAQSLGWMSLADEDFIESRTGETMGHLAEWRGVNVVNMTDNDAWARWRETSRAVIGLDKVSGLLEIKGVGYPMATAVLCILGPETWPVIDRWAAQTVFGTREDAA